MGAEAIENQSSTNEVSEADTSSEDFTNHEPLQSDNSDEIAQEPAKQDENVQDGEPQQQSAKQDAAKPKFETLEAALQGYENLEKKLGEQSNELGELREKAKKVEELEQLLNTQALQEANKNGFNTVKEFENHKEVVKAEADAYAKHINECEFPDEMVNLLTEYRRKPSKELRETIESQFSTDVLKEVAGEMAIFKGQLQTKENEALQQQLETSAKAYLDENVGKYAEEFKNPGFAKLYGEAFRAYGCDLSTEKFVELMNEYKDHVLKSLNIQKEIDNQNNSETDEIIGTSNTGSSASQTFSGDLLKMNEKDLKAAISKFI